MQDVLISVRGVEEMEKFIYLRPSQEIYQTIFTFCNLLLYCLLTRYRTSGVYLKMLLYFYSREFLYFSEHRMKPDVLVFKHFCIML